MYNSFVAAPVARWLRNGREVPEGARYRTEVQNDVFRLIIKEVWDIDAGEYTCEVSNVFGSDSATATLTVQGSIRRLLDTELMFSDYFHSSWRCSRKLLE